MCVCMCSNVSPHSFNEDTKGDLWITDGQIRVEKKKNIYFRLHAHIWLQVHINGFEFFFFFIF